jgi:NSS family neurotransmitter:Na+ symporter
MSPEMANNARETFASRFGLLMTMTGVAVGLGNVWRFPYMVGRFGGASFVLLYLLMVVFIGIPALMAEWTLGRHTRRGTLGAFEFGGLPGGKYVGYLLFIVVFCATAYYTNTLGWVAFHGIGQAVSIIGIDIDTAAVLPPNSGFDLTSLMLQLVMTCSVIGLCAIVLKRGLRRGIERVSKLIMPMLLVILLILVARSLTLEGAGEGLRWYLGELRVENLNGAVMAAALGQAVFSLSLGGTFMVIYGSYLGREAHIPTNALLTGVGDATAGFLAGLAILPAVFALGLQPDSGPSLIFNTLPETFARMPMGGLFGALFFLGLFGAAFLSDVAAMEVLIGGIVDTGRRRRTPAVAVVCIVVAALAIPTMVNMKIFFPWDLIFGSGMQTLGCLVAVITTAWCIKRSGALKELARDSAQPFHHILYTWMRFVIPVAVVCVGVKWLVDAF